MRKDELTTELRELAIDFFFCFSRFEFALKENGYLKSRNHGSAAEAGWTSFVIKWRENYKPTKAAADLIRASPKRQVVGARSLEFVEMKFDEKASSLEIVTGLTCH